ncbi:MAG: type II secretion system protein [Wolinella sp.]
MRHGFTMVELVFVIVMLGILAAVAVPKMAASRDDACVVKLRSDVAVIKSEVSLKSSKDFLLGASSILEATKVKNILGIPSTSTCRWSGDGTQYTATDGKRSTTFTLSANDFICDGNDFCNKITTNRE